MGNSILLSMIREISHEEAQWNQSFNNSILKSLKSIAVAEDYFFETINISAKDIIEFKTGTYSLTSFQLEITASTFDIDLSFRAKWLR